ncbi:MAG: hypothetical protein GXP35_02725 [Actinobacteria bacterium]|nr:hypothetical protein [Actinomycetota bacterium]
MTSRIQRGWPRSLKTIAFGLPVLGALVAFGATFGIRSSAPEEFGHTVTLMAQHDGRLGVFVQRNQAIEALGGDHEGVRVDPRFSSLIDVVATASSQAQATVLAEQTATQMVDERRANTEARFVVVIDAATASLVDLEREIADATFTIADEPDMVVAQALQRELNVLIDTASGFRRQISVARTDLSAVLPALVTASSTPDGRTAPNALRDAALAGIVAALAAFLLVSFIPDTARRR